MYSSYMIKLNYVRLFMILIFNNGLYSILYNRNILATIQNQQSTGNQNKKALHKQKPVQTCIQGVWKLKSTNFKLY